MSEQNYMTRQDVEEYVKEQIELLRSQVKCDIKDIQEESNSSIIKKLDEIKNDIKETQKSQDSRIEKIEDRQRKLEPEVSYVKEKANEYKITLDKIDEKLSRCITCDNLEEKLQKPLKCINDSITDLKHRPDSEKAQIASKILWIVIGVAFTAVVSLILSKIGLL